ncbi:hypothetical protein K431DRAFT_296516 [Polychaeton citri CBS 116435]|uniref:UBC core domain-containing protein n=1 Tax=Polychaeton citri CBS 116435 TaxID=1314669 RepID=A0A9P4UMK5_9PEZI|nr:hypothetical protein K431DRAFT_296516 [Polychaeton citri CBS 116435]
MSKSPTVKRIMKEAAELASSPSTDYHAAPLENDMYEWHFTLRGPPERGDGSPSPYAGGMYHGRIILPPAYPLKPPSFRFLTPTGRFEVNREICLSISGHHEETWQPAWGIRTALVAIRSFMDTDAKGQLGGMDANEEVRKRFAGQSQGWRCPVCMRINGHIMREQDEAVKESGNHENIAEVPDELQLAYKEDIKEDMKKGQKGASVDEVVATPSTETSTPAPALAPVTTTTTAPTPRHLQSQARLAPPTRRIELQRTETPETRPPGSATTERLHRQRQELQQDHGVLPWIDKAIYGVMAMLFLLLIRKISCHYGMGASTTLDGFTRLHDLSSSLPWHLSRLPACEVTPVALAAFYKCRRRIQTNILGLTKLVDVLLRQDTIFWISTRLAHPNANSFVTNEVGRSNDVESTGQFPRQDMRLHAHSAAGASYPTYFKPLTPPIMSFARAYAARSLRQSLRHTSARPVARAARPGQAQLVARRWASTGGDHGAPSSDLPWLITSVAVTLPAAYYLWPSASSAEHGHGHEEHAEEESEDDSKQEEEPSEEPAPAAEEKSEDAPASEEKSDDAPAEQKEESKPSPAGDSQESEGYKPEEDPAEKSGSKHSTNIRDDPNKSKKGEGVPETAKISGTVDPNRPQA